MRSVLFPQITGEAEYSQQNSDNVYVENGQLVAVFNAATSAKVQIDIYSMQGKLMKSEVFTPSTGRNTKVINATLATGAYVVKMTQNGLSNYKKLIK